MRDFQLPGRSPVYGTRAMAATSHPLATEAALDALRRGGTAADAAVAAVAVQCVVEPQSTGIGGDCFWLYAPPRAKTPLGYNGSGRAPAALSLRDIEGTGAIDPQSPHAVTVPGAVDAWERLIGDHGRLGLDAALEPAIRYAEGGWPVAPAVAGDWALAAATLRNDPAAAAYLPGGRPPRAGELMRSPALAATLRAVAEGGRDGFYEGAVAEDIVEHLRSLGGVHTLEDLASHSGERVVPLSLRYRGWKVWECPPNSQGFVALEMLSVLSGYDLAAHDPAGAERLHLEAEAWRLALADRDALLCDPEQREVPVSRLLSRRHADALRARIEPGRAMTRVPALGARTGDTVYLCVVDEDGAACSLINSLFHPFGSGICAPRSGVLLHNRGAGFATGARHPNRLRGGRRPLHTLMPGMAFKGKDVVMPFGVMGGDYQAIGHAHVMTGIADYDMDLQQALDQPRTMHAYGALLAEATVPESTLRRLQAYGHEVLPAGGGLGGGQMISLDRTTGVLCGASDQRKDGFAAGW